MAMLYTCPDIEKKESGEKRSPRFLQGGGGITTLKAMYATASAPMPFVPQQEGASTGE